MSSFEVFSHPEIPLVVHLKNVADRCLDKFVSNKILRGKYFNDELWQKLIWLMGFCHDFGKACRFFQEYLKEEDKDVKASMKAKNETSHALISAVIVHFILRKLVDEWPENNDMLDIIPFLVFIAVKRHHGHVNNAVRIEGGVDGDFELEIPFEHLDVQFQNIDTEIFNHFLSVISDRCGVTLDKSDFPDSLTEYFTQTIKMGERNRFKRLDKSLDHYFIFQYLFSLLIQADKEDAIFNRMHEFGRKSIKNEVVKDYIKSNFDPPQTRMNIIRAQIFNDADKMISQVDFKNKKIFSLNVPTGTGKTFTSLSVALQLRKRVEDENGVSPRIIYALPFTSIIDQNHKVFEKILDNPDSDIIIKHHHLADIFFKSNDHEFETDESKFLIESWGSEIVVTTMFQLFHSILTNQNRMLIKFEKFANAIVLCDEIQSLPYKYWLLAKTIMESMSNLFNTYFVLITATQPRIFNQGQIAELVPEKSTYFSELDRVDISFEQEPVTLEEYQKICRSAIETNNESYLFVMNTVNSALELFESLKDSDCGGEFFFLSTNIIPKDRLSSIERIRELKTRKIIVATQMIEAGVDIDVENVWRDMGPLEAINQVCGRCNRNFGKKRGRVRIYQILNEMHRNTPFEKYIYGKNPLSMTQTRHIITGNKTVSEANFLGNMDLYYSRIEERLRNDDSKKIIASMKNLYFSSVYNSFRLIDEDSYERKDIFIEFDERAMEVWREYLNIREMTDKIERKFRFLKIKKNFSDYIVTVPAKFVSEIEFSDTGFVYISNDMLPVCYHEITGWIRKTEGIYTF